ncbi:outer membrane protein assembly factor BamD [Blattabacterium cuenoti]|uniref:outer membrane protein assembly factor BamD n=1 Tax=Blattabacterium cuenoti TaxID=1653831 RepID=UPI00163D02D5|nr:outer membrane protein assembly factor BamD [Blattabacterium cuenoti]
MNQKKNICILILFLVFLSSSVYGYGNVLNVLDRESKEKVREEIYSTDRKEIINRNNSKWDEKKELFQKFFYRKNIQSYSETKEEKNFEEYEFFRKGLNFYFSSLNFDLDQKNTYMAIDILNQFIQRFQNSSKITEANKLLNELLKKIEKKDYYIANIYFSMQKNYAALVSFRDFLNDFPKSNFKENVLYKICIIRYRIAIANNTNHKKNISDFLESYKKYVKSYPNNYYHIKKLQDLYKKLMNN